MEATTFTDIRQKPEAGMVAPDSDTVAPPAIADTDPEAHVVDPEGLGAFATFGWGAGNGKGLG